ncbi:hypothetical protein Salat_2828300 [Sesamum alatum]|uniref:Uncharacterized protein n=1 Tax=Sesamum alatum TaxID=300844 RepID=A0AAE2C9X4_9LAMI|nr:hypothetical protein Salat_2828300 [Sesamum alatum]
MPQLRHLIFYESVLPMPLAAIHGGQVLENLQTLCGVKDFTFTRKVIEMVPNLKKLKAFYTTKSREKWAKYCLNNLVHLCHLKTLEIRFTYICISKENSLQALLYHPRLRS